MTRVTTDAAGSVSTVVEIAIRAARSAGKTIDAGGNGRICDRSQTVDLAQLNRTAIARGQRIVFALPAAMPDRTDDMNHMPRW
jgi:hypothetical protein